MYSTLALLFVATTLLFFFIKTIYKAFIQLMIEHDVVAKHITRITQNLKLLQLDKLSDSEAIVTAIKQSTLEYTIKQVLRDADKIQMAYTDVAAVLNVYTRKRKLNWTPTPTGIQLSTSTGSVNFTWSS